MPEVNNSIKAEQEWVARVTRRDPAGNVIGIEEYDLSTRHKNPAIRFFLENRKKFRIIGKALLVKPHSFYEKVISNGRRNS